MLNSCPKVPKTQQSQSAKSSGQPFPSGSPSSTALRVLRVIGTYHWHVIGFGCSVHHCSAWCFNRNSLDDNPWESPRLGWVAQPSTIINQHGCWKLLTVTSDMGTRWTWSYYCSWYILDKRNDRQRVGSRVGILGVHSSLNSQVFPWAAEMTLTPTSWYEYFTQLWLCSKLWSHRSGRFSEFTNHFCRLNLHFAGFVKIIPWGLVGRRYLIVIVTILSSSF